MNDKELICLLKAEIQDLQDQLAGAIPPDAEFMDDLNLDNLRDTAVREAVRRSVLQKDAAEALGIDRWTLCKMMRRMGLEQPDKWDAKRRQRSSVCAADPLHWKQSA